MVTAGTQKKAVARTRAAKAKANATVKKAVEEAVARTNGSGYGFTAEAIVEARDGQGMSWANVAKAVGLSNPGQARRAYTELTGKPHYDSRMAKGSTGRAPRGTSQRARKKAASLDPKWHDDSDQDEIAERLEGAWIIVRRSTGYEEEVHVEHATEFRYEGKAKDAPLTVTLTTYTTKETRTYGQQRTFRVRDIVQLSATQTRRRSAVKTLGDELGMEDPDNQEESTEEEQ